MLHSEFHQDPWEPVPPSARRRRVISVCALERAPPLRDTPSMKLGDKLSKKLSDKLSDKFSYKLSVKLNG